MGSLKVLMMKVIKSSQFPERIAMWDSILKYANTPILKCSRLICKSLKKNITLKFKLKQNS
jgi:hypothetical protein